MNSSNAARRWSGPPLALQITGLLLAGLVVAQLVTLGLTWLLPPQPPPQYDLADIARVLAGEPVDPAVSRVLQRVVRAEPPQPSGPGWLTSERSRHDLAALVGRDDADVRLFFYTPLPFAGAAGPPPGLGAAAAPAMRQRSRWLAPAAIDAGLIRVDYQVAQAGPAPRGGGFGAPGGAFPAGGGMGGGMGSFPNGGFGSMPSPSRVDGGGMPSGGFGGASASPGGTSRSMPSMGRDAGGSSGLAPAGASGTPVGPLAPTTSLYAPGLPGGQGLGSSAGFGSASGFGPSVGFGGNGSPGTSGAGNALATGPHAGAMAAPSGSASTAAPQARTAAAVAQRSTSGSAGAAGAAGLAGGTGAGASLAARTGSSGPAGQGTSPSATARPAIAQPRHEALAEPAPGPAADAHDASRPLPGATAPSATTPAESREKPQPPTLDPGSSATSMSADAQASSPAASSAASATPRGVAPASPSARARSASSTESSPAETPSRGLFGLSPAPFVVGDFVAAMRLPQGGWAMVQPVPEAFPNAWQRRVLLWFLVAALVVAPLGWWFSRRLVRPIAGFARAAEQLGRDPLAPVLALEGPAEVGRAAQAFNRMQSRMRSFVDDRTAMIGAISHDMRTPLTRLRFRIEEVPEDMQAGMLGDVDEMERMISSVLAFIRDASEPGARERLDLSSIVEDVVEDAVFVGKDVRLERSEEAAVDVDAIGMRRLLDNLVENAVKYGHDARVRLFVDREDAVAEVSDSGPGLSDRELERVFEPFYRSPAARASGKQGSGLGLAVCRSIARAHGGDVHLRRGSHGMVAQVRLPLAIRFATVD